MQAMVRGYHVYKSIWDAAACDDDILPCEKEVGNPHDPSSIAVKKGTDIIGHMPRKISKEGTVVVMQPLARAWVKPPPVQILVVVANIHYMFNIPLV